jgi:tetratricopeptide (TPR) repeat protein
MIKNLEDLLSKGRFDDANKLLAENRQKLETWRYDCLSAAVSLSSSDFASARRKLEAAVLQQPDNWLPNHLLAKLHTKLGNGPTALMYARVAHTSNPKDQQTLLFLLHSLLDNGRVDETLSILESLSQSQQQLLPVRLAFVSCFRAKRRFEEALDLLKKLELEHSNNATVMRLRADIEGDLNSERGMVFYERALHKQEQGKAKRDNLTRWNAALHFLRGRRFEMGWDCWEAGFEPEVGTMARALPDAVKSIHRIKYDQSIPEEGWLLIVPEQGIGDQILFLSGLSDMMASTSNTNWLLVGDVRLTPILKRTYPQLIVANPGIIDGWNTNSLPKAGFIPYGSILPRVRPTTEAFNAAAKHAYLRPNSKMVEEFREHLTLKAGGRRIIGISWAGGYWQTQKQNKTLSLSSWAPLLRKDYLFVSLQYGNTTAEQALVKELKLPLLFVIGIDFKVELDRWFALALATDEIISISTALVHFTGAAGHKTSIVMPEQQGPWVLGNNDKEHMVYPNVSIYRPNKNESISELLVSALK